MPRAARVLTQDPIGADLAVARARARDAIAIADERPDAHALDEPDALQGRRGGEAGERVEGRAVAVAKTEARTLEVARADPRHQGRDPLGREQLHLDAQTVVQRHRLAQRGHAL